MKDALAVRMIVEVMHSAIGFCWSVYGMAGGSVIIRCWRRFLEWFDVYLATLPYQKS